MLDWIRYTIENYSFGVFRTIAPKLGLPVDRVRLTFIYLSLISFGSPLFLYLVAAFWINLKKYLRRGYNLLVS
jgi:phage shock protein PspC (stress-responsive transcriptional regulator)